MTTCIGTRWRFPAGVMEFDFCRSYCSTNPFRDMSFGEEGASGNLRTSAPNPRRAESCHRQRYHAFLTWIWNTRSNHFPGRSSRQHCALTAWVDDFLQAGWRSWQNVPAACLNLKSWNLALATLSCPLQAYYNTALRQKHLGCTIFIGMSVRVANTPASP